MERENLTNMTIADGLETIVLNEKKLEKIVMQVRNYSACNSAYKCNFGIEVDSVNLKPEDTFKVVQKKISAAMDSFKSLMHDSVLIKEAINYTNMHTKISTVLGDMSVHDAIYMKDEMLRTEKRYVSSGIRPGLFAELYKSLQKAKDTAAKEVETYNNRIINSNLADDLKKQSTATVMHFVNDKTCQEYEDVVMLFSDQVNKRLNSINALTHLLVPPEIK